MQQLITEYGYWAILVGCFFEGETILVLGGFAVHRGLLQFEWVVAAAFIGTLAGDQLYFFVGRRWGDWALARWPSWQPGSQRAQRLLERYGTLFILTFRFFYGIRSVSSFAVGMAGYSPLRFALLNMVAAALWAPVVAALGYFFGEAVVLAIDEVKHYELELFGVLAAIGLIVWLVHVARRRRRANRPPVRRHP